MEWPWEVEIECVADNISLSAEMSFTLTCMYRKPSAKSDFYDKLKVLFNHYDFHKKITFAILYEFEGKV